MECGGVEYDEACDAFGASERARHRDHAAPIVHSECDVVTQIEMVEQGFKILHPAVETVGIRLIVWLVGEAAPDMVHGDDPVRGTKFLDQASKEKRPCRIAVYENDGVTLSLVEVVVPMAL